MPCFLKRFSNIFIFCNIFTQYWMVWFLSFSSRLSSSAYICFREWDTWDYDMNQESCATCNCKTWSSCGLSSLSSQPGVSSQPGFGWLFLEESPGTLDSWLFTLCTNLSDFILTLAPLLMVENYFEIPSLAHAFENFLTPKFTLLVFSPKPSGHPTNLKSQNLNLVWYHKSLFVFYSLLLFKAN